MKYARFLITALCAIACSLNDSQLAHAQPVRSQSPKAPQAVGGTPQMHQDSEVRQTGWPSIPLPKISMPKIWMPDFSPITRPVKSGYNKVTSGTKRAWEGTKEMFTFGGSESKETVSKQSSQQQPGFWSRMFASEPEQPSGPQTVGEWMAQPRLDP